MSKVNLIDAKIKEINDDFISKFGEPKEEIINGKKYIKINTWANAFNKFSKAILESFDLLGWNVDEWTDEILLLLEFAKNTEPNIVNFAAKSLSKKCTPNNYTRLFKGLREINARNLGYEKVGNCLMSSLKIWLAGQQTIYASVSNLKRGACYYD